MFNDHDCAAIGAHDDDEGALTPAETAWGSAHAACHATTEIAEAPMDDGAPARLREAAGRVSVWADVAERHRRGAVQ